MKYIQLNNTELNISPICLGTAGFGDKSDLEKSFEILNAFVWAGGNFIDTANVYCKWLKGHGNCSEQIIGKWLKESGMQGKVIVATKGAHYSFEDPGRSRVNKEDIRMDLDESCRTLGKDEMDFYWLHRDDPEKPAEEIVDILEELKKEGRIRYYGFSNYRTERLKEIAQCLRERNLQGSQQYPISGVLQESIPEEIQIRILHLWSFPGKNISGTVRQALLPFRFLPLQWDFFQNFRKWGFPLQMQRWMHPG